jgi:circadian clock protein KaiA
LPSQLSIYAFLSSDSLAQSLQQILSSERYVLTLGLAAGAFSHFTKAPEQSCDCLIVEGDPTLLTLVEQLYEEGMLFPVVFLTDTKNFFAHLASVEIDLANLSQLSDAIDQAIAQFINLPLASKTNSKNQKLLQLKQQQLAEKFHDKSCYTIGFYKRKPYIFFQELKSDYRQILLNYFAEDITLKQKIDSFINTAFSSDIPVPQIIEIHMELIDEFSKQLKLEGRNDEVLLDYRLTLIDILAHLCEVYRCSIPKQS